MDTYEVQKAIYNICPYTFYRNEQLLKDTCLIPYTFHKLYNYKVVIVTAKKEEYTYLELLPGLEMDIQPPAEDMEQWTRHCCEYIKNNYKEIDILFCFGSYTSYTKMVPLYKSLRKDGEVILKLDANSGWIDKISIQDPEYKKLYENCDLITCETKRIKRMLSKKWPYKIDYISNGFLDLKEKSDYLDISSYDSKENVILTVGRIGTAQKANHILLEAFAECADRIREWKLKLVGSIEPAFEKYIEEYFFRYPELKERVIFTGKIIDKDKLNEEYRKATIFALTSISEGGTPNVFVEAAKNGCYMICSKIDAVDEFTNNGQCGQSFDITEIEGLKNIFLEVCREEFEPNLRHNFMEIQKYCKRFFDYETMVKKLVHLMKINKDEMYNE